MENHGELLDILGSLERSKNVYSSAVKDNVLEKCCYIVEVGALTVTTDTTGKVTTQNTEHPMQFSEKAVNTILSMKWYDGNGSRIEPIIYGRNDWYRARLRMVEESIELFEKLRIKETVSN